MTQIEVSSLQVGARVRLAYAHHHKTGTVDMFANEGNYVRVAWDSAKRPDVLSRTSPLWLMMELTS